MKRAASDTRFPIHPVRVPRRKVLNDGPLAEAVLETRHVPAPVLLCIGLHPSLLKAQRASWKSAGCIVTSAATIPKAIVSIAAGDFDLVLLGARLAIEDRERLAFLIRSTGSAVPIVCVADVCACLETTDSPSPQKYSETVLGGISEVLAGDARTQPVVTRRGRHA
ncbi:MAG: hypothetical protein WBD91_08495 [Acidobacteriaceae bacterium]